MHTAAAAAAAAVIVIASVVCNGDYCFFHCHM